MLRTNVNSAPVEAGHGNVESLALVRIKVQTLTATDNYIAELGGSGMPRTNVNSAPVEAGHGNVESLALHPDDVLHGNLAVLKKRGSLKVHKNENIFGSDFEFCTISLLVMLKY